MDFINFLFRSYPDGVSGAKVEKKKNEWKNFFHSWGGEKGARVMKNYEKQLVTGREVSGMQFAF